MDPTGKEPNPYTYAQANPCNKIDPTGTSAICDAIRDFSLATAGLGLAAGLGALYATGTIAGVPLATILTAAGISLGAGSLAAALIHLALC